MFFRNASRDEFVSRCAGKKIICFGASRMPHEAVRELPISGQIECILDNNPDKIGRNVILCDRKIPVHTPEWLCGKQLDGHILLITSRFYYDIFQQLQQYRTLDGVDCYAWPCLMLDDESTPEKLRQSRIASQCRENYREYLDACALPPEETEERLNALESEWNSSKGRFVFPSIVLLHSNICTLRCEHCCDLIPSAASRYHLPPDEILRDLDIFLRGVDECVRVDLTDGESFLYSELAELVRRVAEKPKVRTVFMFTNATLMPTDDVLDALRSDKVFIRISDYGMMGSAARLVETLEAHGIHFSVISGMKWKRLPPPSKRHETREWLRYEFLRCVNKKCSKALFQNRLYACMPAFRLAHAGVFASERDFVTLNDLDSDEELAQKIRSISLIDFVEACHYCNFANEALPYIDAGPSSGSRSAYTLIRRDKLNGLVDSSETRVDF